MKRKRIILIIMVIIISLFLVYLFIKNKKYQINELANANNLEIKLVDANYNKNQKKIEFTFSIKNTNKYSITLNSYTNFKMYGIKQTEMYSGEISSKIVKTKEKILYNVSYNTKQLPMYEIMFNSGKDKINFIVSHEDLNNSL